MTRLAPVLLATLCTGCALATNSASIERPQAASPHKARTLTPFDSMRELKRAMAQVTEARAVEKAKQRERQRQWCRESGIDAVACGKMVMETVTVSGQAAGVESVTNNQHADLDEGGIVKRLGDVLIVLRRGRLFTIGIGSGQLDALAVTAAYDEQAVGADSEHTWYDELLVWQNTVIVIGFSYERGGTEIGIFDLAATGTLQHRETYHLRSTDYYSGTNYSSRLIGGRLLLFTTAAIPDDVDPSAWLPGMRRWDGWMPQRPFDSIAPVTRVFRPVADLGAYSVVHSLTSCHLMPRFGCEATVIIGDSLTTYYVSPRAAYAWTTVWARAERTSVLYRMPLDGAPVSAIGVRGAPSDQFAFFEDQDAHLNVVTHTDESIELLRVPVTSFSDGTVAAPASNYQRLAAGSDLFAVTRFIGQYVLLGIHQPYRDQKWLIVAANWARGKSFTLNVAHGVERIEAMGSDAVAVGNDDAQLRMTAIGLGDQPYLAGTLTQQQASQSESRSHAFGYRSDTHTTGLFGLPTFAIDRGYVAALDEPAARVLFVRHHGLAFQVVGAIAASAGQDDDDDCRASCADWYGNARPIFIDDRIFALMGYEIVEGRLVDGRIETTRRIDFMPRKSTRN